MSNSVALSDRYSELIDEIVQTTLKGKIRSKEQVYRLLVQNVAPGTGEIFERCLGDQLVATQRQVETQTDEFKLAKATRIQRALQTIQGEWERWQVDHQATTAIAATADALIQAAPSDRLSILLRAMDPNRQPPLTLAQIQSLAKTLETRAATLDHGAEEIRAIARGLVQGLVDWQRLENHLVSWIYDQGQGHIGFGGVPGQSGPWALWAQQVGRDRPQSLLQSLAFDQSATEWAAHQRDWTLEDMVALAIVLQCLQQGLVAWFDKLVYDSKVGSKLSISTFLTFAVIWSQMANGFGQSSFLSSGFRALLVDGCFQVTLQVLRAFSQRDYFPLYGSLYASFAGKYMREALHYLDEPLSRVEGTQEKARILTLLGNSARAQGHADRAIALYEQALEIARAAGDLPCEIADLNHLSRTYVSQKSYGEAIRYSQQALILSRQAGDRPGEANALANFGYSEVLQARQDLGSEADRYEMAMDYLQQGLKLAERLGDRQSQALCLTSLGLTQLVLEQPQGAIAYLEGGIQAAQFSGDLYLQALNLSHLADAYYRLQSYGLALRYGSLGMYLLAQIASQEWRQSAALLTVLRGQVGPEGFENLRTEERSAIAALIGVDGYDHIPTLLAEYQASLDS